MFSRGPLDMRSTISPRKVHDMLDLLCVKRFIALFLAMLLMAPIAAEAQAPQSDAASLQAQGTQPAQAEPHTQQDIASAIPDAPLPQQTQPPEPPPTPQSDSAPQQSTTTPVGTAAAPSEKPVGVAGSRPAGAVIAPAKQRRVRTILISIGVIVGAGIAVGTVAALSHSSPSQPH